MSFRSFRIAVVAASLLWPTVAGATPSLHPDPMAFYISPGFYAGRGTQPGIDLAFLMAQRVNTASSNYRHIVFGPVLGGEFDPDGGRYAEVQLGWVHTSSGGHVLGELPWWWLTGGVGPRYQRDRTVAVQTTAAIGSLIIPFTSFYARHIWRRGVDSRVERELGVMFKLPLPGEFFTASSPPE